ncbi:MAG TPA: DNA polymerase ligase N-terminal domain-containing protein [Streptosporangiaceae bacterium]|nr:DNA polymerase ligase N-terminal domain-containing protein [Streptosporangiaceae bacterium]
MVKRKPGQKAEPEDGARRLGAYQAKRDFTRTPEPSGGPGKEDGTGPGAQPALSRFVVQRHRARRLHYDLRFEIGGVLVSWAVPKGPTLDPAVKRLAVHVEDHPIEYLGFEGVIPSREYGAGDVIVWDTGTWELHAADDPAAAVAGGEFHADVYGSKLRGRFILIRRGGQHGQRGVSQRGVSQRGASQRGASRPGDGQDEWLLLHKDDAAAVSGWDPEDHPASVLSGRTNEEVQADPDRMWRADLPAAQASVTLRAPRTPAPTGDELAALDELGTGGTWEIFGRRLKLTNLDKDLFPGRDARPGQSAGPPVTKRELIRYTARVAPVALPYLAGRPLNMHRFPGGAGKPGFWHRQLPEHAPDWLPRWQDPDAGRGKTHTYLMVDEAAALVWAANFGALEWHAWTATAADPDQPSYALIDIDPGPATSWEDVLVLARLHRTALEHIGVRAAPKLTGRRGLHIWIPVTAGLSFHDTRAWTEQLSKAIGTVVPELVSWKWDVRDRGGLARLDYTQNVHNKTLVAPYSPRAAPGAPVSAPIAWDELDDPGLAPDGITMETMPDRLAEHGDLFAAALGPPQPLPPLH